MPADTRKFTKRLTALRPEGLSAEAKTWARAAKAARDPGTKQAFEEMAERRDLLARAVKALANDPPADDEGGAATSKPGKDAKKP